MYLSVDGFPATDHETILCRRSKSQCLPGGTTDQKRKLAKRISDALLEEAGARREAIGVAFDGISKESYASGGELMIDKARPK